MRISEMNAGVVTRCQNIFFTQRKREGEEEIKWGKERERENKQNWISISIFTGINCIGAEWVVIQVLKCPWLLSFEFWFLDWIHWFCTRSSYELQMRVLCYYTFDTNAIGKQSCKFSSTNPTNNIFEHKLDAHLVFVFILVSLQSPVDVVLLFIASDCDSVIFILPNRIANVIRLKVAISQNLKKIIRIYFLSIQLDNHFINEVCVITREKQIS